MQRACPVLPPGASLGVAASACWASARALMTHDPRGGRGGAKGLGTRRVLCTFHEPSPNTWSQAGGAGAAGAAGAHCIVYHAAPSARRARRAGRAGRACCGAVALPWPCRGRCRPGPPARSRHGATAQREGSGSSASSASAPWQTLAAFVPGCKRVMAGTRPREGPGGPGRARGGLRERSVPLYQGPAGPASLPLCAALCADGPKPVLINRPK